MPISKCRCASAFQDEKYGPGNRVHNPCKCKTGTMNRCTVCGESRGSAGVAPGTKTEEKPKK